MARMRRYFKTPFTDLNKLKMALNKRVKKQGFLPSRAQLRKAGRSDLAHGIRVRGGFNKVAKEMGVPLKKRIVYRSAFTDRQQAIKALEYVKKMTAKTPTVWGFGKTLGLGAYNRIDRYHGVSKLLRELGWKRQIPVVHASKFRNLNLLREELNKKIIPKVGRFPTKKDLIKINRQDLRNAIRFHGGYRKLQALFPGEVKKFQNPWKDFDYAALRCFELKQKHGHWLSATELRKIGLRSVLAKINRHQGDFAQFIPRAKKLGRLFEKLNQNDILAIKAKAGDLSARNELIEKNMGLVGLYAKSLRAFDFMNEGIFGLDRAAKTYDFRRGHFSAYAGDWIRITFQRALMKQRRIIRLPVPVHEEMNKLIKTTSALTGELGRVPSRGEIANAMNIPESRVGELQSLSIEPESLDAIEPETEKRPLLEDKKSLAGIPESSESVRGAVMQRESLELLGNAIARLNPKERRALILRRGLQFGIGKNYAPIERPLEAVGILMGITREGVRLLENRAIAKLKKFMNS